jgi:hypothetical protein
VRLLAWKPLARGPLRGFLDLEVELGRDGNRRLQILECPVRLEASGRPWVGLPGKPQLDRNGNTRRKSNGRPDYTAVLKWTTKADSDAFSDAALRLLLARYPDALDADAEDSAA